jgi:hypothetical protein
MRKFLSVYSYIFTRIWRIQGKCSSVYGEYGEFRVVCSTQNRFRIRRNNLRIDVEDGARDTKLCISQLIIIQIIIFYILSIYTIAYNRGWIKSKNHLTLLSLYVVFYRIQITKTFEGGTGLRNMDDSGKVKEELWDCFTTRRRCRWSIGVY